jgi:acyl-coenzyme A synthetase/AMP-(fatty) acid ligase
MRGMNITDPIRRVARLRPGAIAVIRADGSGVSYQQLDRTIDALLVRVAGLGIAPGQTAGLALAGPDEFPSLVLALALARGGIATTDTTLPAHHMDVCFLPAGAAAKPGVPCVPFDPGWARAPSTPVEAAAALRPQDGAAVCRIFASSGTTGTPRFAAISHATMTRRVQSNWLSMGPPEPVQICAVSLGITWGFSSMLRTLWAGGTLVLTNPAQAVAAIQRHRVNAMVISPISLQSVIAAMPRSAPPLPSLKAIEVGGSLLPARLYALARQKLCGNIVSYFGAMETGGVASAPMAVLAGDSQAVGYVHAGVTVAAVDADGRKLPPGTEGILRIRSANNIAGYLDDTGVSPFRDGWFCSGDVGAVSQDGLLRVAGRTSEFINSGGVKLSPHVIEDVLLALPEVTEAAAFGVPDELGVDQIWAAIVANVPIDAGMLNAACRERLPQSPPKFIIQLKGLPRNANGKVVREELVKFALARRKPPA